MRRQKQRCKWCHFKPKDSKDCWQPPEAGKAARGRLSLRGSGGTNPAGALNLDSRPPDCGRVHFCCFKPLILLCYSSPRKLYRYKPNTWGGDKVLPPPIALSWPPYSPTVGLEPSSESLCHLWVPCASPWSHVSSQAILSPGISPSASHSISWRRAVLGLELVFPTTLPAERWEIS